MNLHDPVKLISFNGAKESPDNVEASENYWKLVGKTGKIVQDPNEANLEAGFSKKIRYLVQFDEDLKSFNLVCHNNVPNSLWMLETDLIIQENGPGHS